jgi:hypothetical protein
MFARFVRNAGHCSRAVSTIDALEIGIERMRGFAIGSREQESTFKKFSQKYLVSCEREFMKCKICSLSDLAEHNISAGPRSVFDAGSPPGFALVTAQTRRSRKSA